MIPSSLPMNHSSLEARQQTCWLSGTVSKSHPSLGALSAVSSTHAGLICGCAEPSLPRVGAGREALAAFSPPEADVIY